LDLHAEAGYILPYGPKRFEEDDGQLDEVDRIRLTDRFYLGEPQLRGFDIRGIGPRVVRYGYNSDNTTLNMTKDGRLQDDALGGRADYLGHIELQIPLGEGAKQAGFKPSIFMDAGSVFGVKAPQLDNGETAPNSPALIRPITDANGLNQCQTTNTTTGTTTLNSIPKGSICPSGTTLYANNIPAYQEVYYGGNWKPRVSVGFGVSWNSPFGPLRIDIAKALVKQKGDETKLFSFNVGTQF